MINDENKIYIGDTGLAIICDMNANISGATNIVLNVRKPDGTIVIWNAEEHSIDGESNYVKYITQEDDLDQRGRYKVQPRATISGWTGRGETAEFRVEGLFR